MRKRVVYQFSRPEIEAQREMLDGEQESLPACARRVACRELQFRPGEQDLWVTWGATMVEVSTEPPLWA